MNSIIPDLTVVSRLQDDFYDFNSVATTGKWKVTKGTGGSIANLAGTSGILSVPTAASANDYVLLSTQVASLGLISGKSFHCEAMIKLTEANTDQSNIVFGLSSILTTGFLVTANAGPPTTFDGCVVWKQGGTSVWQCTASQGANQSSNANLGAFTSGAWTRIGFEFDANMGLFTPLINGQPLIYQTKPATVKIAALGSLATSLYPIIGVVAGSGSAETLLIDYVDFQMAR